MSNSYHFLPCSTKTPCPTTGDYYYCTDGISFNSCLPTNKGPFPTSSCTSQCLTSRVSKPQTPPSTEPTCASEVKIMCPKT
jgi:hypothetical protein